MPMQGNWTNTTEYQDRYTYNHKEQVTGLEWFAYGARPVRLPADITMRRLGDLRGWTIIF